MSTFLYDNKAIKIIYFIDADMPVMEIRLTEVFIALLQDMR